MSRRGRTEIGFGSDSFLDIIANIVGILIILIVVAGLRVSNAPLPNPVATPIEKPIVEVEAPKSTPKPPVPKPVAVVKKLPLPPSPSPTQTVPQPKPIAPTRPDPELLSRIDQLERDIASLERETTATNARIAGLQTGVAALKTSTRNVQSRTQTIQANAALLESRLDRLKLLLQRNENELKGLRLQYDEARRRPKKTQVIRHKLTPVSRLVKGKEKHFRLFTRKVSHVPIDMLVKHMRKDVVAQKNWLMKFRRHQGEVGPVEGFSMKYVVERKKTAAIDQLRNGGYGQISIVLSEWRILPSPELTAETTGEALQTGSAFLRELRSTDPATTLTFWVYPDSFPAFRELQRFAHREGFTVAARPLPFGVPIAGSPRGTRSAGQ